MADGASVDEVAVADVASVDEAAVADVASVPCRSVLGQALFDEPTVSRGGGGMVMVGGGMLCQMYSPWHGCTSPQLPAVFLRACRELHDPIAQLCGSRAASNASHDVPENLYFYLQVRDIEFASTSTANLLPFHGRCHVAYMPSHGVVLGLSKFARLTGLFAR